MIAFSLDLKHGVIYLVEILFGSDVEGHELQRQVTVILHHRENNDATTFYNACAAESVHHQSFMRACLAVEPGKKRHEEQDRQKGNADRHRGLLQMRRRVGRPGRRRT